MKGAVLFMEVSPSSPHGETLCVSFEGKDLDMWASTPSQVFKRIFCTATFSDGTVPFYLHGTS